MEKEGYDSQWSCELMEIIFSLSNSQSADTKESNETNEIVNRKFGQLLWTCMRERIKKNSVKQKYIFE